MTKSELICQSVGAWVVFVGCVFLVGYLTWIATAERLIDAFNPDTIRAYAKISLFMFASSYVLSLIFMFVAVRMVILYGFF